MANTQSRSTRATTSPKGRRTRSRDELEGPAPRDTVTLQWIGVGVLVAGLLVAAFYFARDQQPQNIHGGLPATEFDAGPAA